MDGIGTGTFPPIYRCEIFAIGRFFVLTHVVVRKAVGYTFLVQNLSIICLFLIILFVLFWLLFLKYIHVISLLFRDKGHFAKPSQHSFFL